MPSPRNILTLAFAIAFLGASQLLAQQPCRSCEVQASQGVFGFGSQIGSQAFYAPQAIMSYQTVAKPMQYSGTSLTQRQYPTPLRDMVLGKTQVQHYYTPHRSQMGQQPSQAISRVTPTAQVARPQRYEVRLIMPQ